MEVAWSRLLGWPSQNKPVSQYVVVKDSALCDGAPFVYQLAAAYLQHGCFLVYLSTERPWYSLYLSLRKLGVHVDSKALRNRILFFDCTDTWETVHEDYPGCFLEHVTMNITSDCDWIGQVCSLMEKYLFERSISEPLSVAVIVDSSTSLLYLSKQPDSFSLLFHYLRVMEQKLDPALYCVCQLVHFDMGYGDQLLKEAQFYDSLVLHLEALSLDMPSEQDGRVSTEIRDQIIDRAFFKILENQIKFFTI